MGRLKGSKNKQDITRPITSHLSSEERVKLLANLIIDKIVEDQQNGLVIFKQLTGKK